ncbi:metallophosphoesterase [Caenimonas soli]|uniref:metallophosphoesterase n=1 Tax=Caenimonas soli TaxID=2735555 RepID=UPI0015557FA5|nr:metallophosphoesterase [Caenimonas soli]NPC56679.1 metallophosphoesterase [Caenimonas soli]
MDYDIIGDIHGQADKLHALLDHLGYREREGAYRHRDRTAIFVGDFIDRGPRQLDSVMTVRRMTDTGSALAVMGNHEFNAIAWHTRDPDRDGEFLRPRSGALGRKNREQHAAFLAEVEDRGDLHEEIVDWFLTLPLWLDLPGFRVVHACWHDGYMGELKPHLTLGLGLTRQLMIAASREGRMEFRTVEGLTKGLEVALPNGQRFHDKDGHLRSNVRIRWWDTEATSYRALALMPEELREQLPDTPIAADVRSPYDNVKPVFFGHYWMTGQPALQSPSAVCVDYSAARGGPLVAYRWDDGAPLSPDRLVWTG